jgi:hypothetical protein
MIKKECSNCTFYILQDNTSICNNPIKKNYTKHNSLCDFYKVNPDYNENNPMLIDRRDDFNFEINYSNDSNCEICQNDLKDKYSISISNNDYDYGYYIEMCEDCLNSIVDKLQQVKKQIMKGE